MHLPALISALDGEKGHKSLIVSSNLCLSFGLKKKKKSPTFMCIKDILYAKPQFSLPGL
jgi:hypothetical protein